MFWIYFTNICSLITFFLFIVYIGGRVFLYLDLLKNSCIEDLSYVEVSFQDIEGIGEMDIFDKYKDNILGDLELSEHCIFKCEKYIRSIRLYTLNTFTDDDFFKFYLSDRGIDDSYVFELLLDELKDIPKGTEILINIETPGEYAFYGIEFVTSDFLVYRHVFWPDNRTGDLHKEDFKLKFSWMGLLYYLCK